MKHILGIHIQPSTLAPPPTNVILYANETALNITDAVPEAVNVEFEMVPAEGLIALNE